MKRLMLLSLLLGTIYSLHLVSPTSGAIHGPGRRDSLDMKIGTSSSQRMRMPPHLKSPKTEADLVQGLDGAGVQERELALTQEVTQTQGVGAQASRHRDVFEEEEEEEEEAMELNSVSLDKDSLCPREEDTVPMEGGPCCRTCRYMLVIPRTFTNAKTVCKRCYKGNLVSIHNSLDNDHIQCGASQVNQGQVWIEGALRRWGATGLLASSSMQKALALRLLLLIQRHLDADRKPAASTPVAVHVHPWAPPLSFSLS
ncbi:LOW QUALITY PROTEIN: proteoglycan 3-like [Thomomys bottae]